jgi:hypothetical protein
LVLILDAESRLRLVFGIASTPNGFSPEDAGAVLWRDKAVSAMKLAEGSILAAAEAQGRICNELVTLTTSTDVSYSHHICTRLEE